MNYLLMIAAMLHVEESDIPSFDAQKAMGWPVLHTNPEDAADARYRNWVEVEARIRLMRADAILAAAGEKEEAKITIQEMRDLRARAEAAESKLAEAARLAQDSARAAMEAVDNNAENGGGE